MSGSGKIEHAEYMFISGALGFEFVGLPFIKTNNPPVRTMIEHTGDQFTEKSNAKCCPVRGALRAFSQLEMEGIRSELAAAAFIDRRKWSQ